MDLLSFSEKNFVNHIVKSEVSAACLEEACIMGIDEAGRGPVLGPMAYGCAYCVASRQDDLKELGVADSKTLTEAKREELFGVLNAHTDSYLGWEVELISPTTICNSMYSRDKVSLNKVSEDAATGLIQRALDKGIRLAHVYLDTVGPPEKYQARLEKIFPNVNITVSKKADSIYPIVSAASICAKVSRDQVIAGWKYPENVQVGEEGWGSGYPNDPVTKSFLQDILDPVFGFPQLVRFSWSTAERIIDQKCLPVTWEEDDEDSSSTPSVLSFFQRGGQTTTEKSKPLHPFFTNRSIKPVTSF